MSVWIKASEQLPPLDEEVVILFKDKEDNIDYDNMYYALAKRYNDRSLGGERWSHFTEYQGYYEVVYWARLYDMPRLESELVNEKENH